MIYRLFPHTPLGNFYAKNQAIKPILNLLTISVPIVKRCKYTTRSLNQRGSYSVDTKDVNLEILHFKQFYKHFVFDKDEEGYVKKTQKNYMDVRVVLQLV